MISLAFCLQAFSELQCREREVRKQWSCLAKEKGNRVQSSCVGNCGSGYQLKGNCTEKELQKSILEALECLNTKLPMCKIRNHEVMCRTTTEQRQPQGKEKLLRNCEQNNCQNLHNVGGHSSSSPRVQRSPREVTVLRREPRKARPQEKGKFISRVKVTLDLP